MLRSLKKSSTTEKVFFALAILVIAMIFVNHGRPQREGFEQTKEFITKKGPMIYDDFYTNVYDDLVFNQIKNDYEVGEIINKTTPESSRQRAERYGYRYFSINGESRPERISGPRLSGSRRTGYNDVSRWVFYTHNVPVFHNILYQG